MTNMKTYTIGELQSILDLHTKWLNEEEGGRCADLGSIDLGGADLRGVDLRMADLRGADLSYADLDSADLRGADLCRAYLRNADLRNADLRGAYLRGADLSAARLINADLEGADLRRAYLNNVCLVGADLKNTDTRGADLSRVCLNSANNAELVHARAVIVPEGEIIGWKKVEVVDGEGEYVGKAVAKLRIPADAERSNAFGRKCRASKAEVLDIEPLCEVPDDAVYRSLFATSFQYSVGATVRPTKTFDPDRKNECASGIHFFITRKEAVAW